MFANRIRELRQQQGMTMTELAFKAGLSVGIIQRYETGKTDPPLSVAHRVAKVLGEPLDSVFPDEHRAVAA
jgi:putative transcriptional regulator